MQPDTLSGSGPSWPVKEEVNSGPKGRGIVISGSAQMWSAGSRSFFSDRLFFGKKEHGTGLEEGLKGLMSRLISGRLLPTWMRPGPIFPPCRGCRERPGCCCA